ncbi:MAG: GyrI-like domain-containing protein [Chitinophagaceae bacterium]
MEPRIEILSEKKLVGKRLRVSLAANKTGELWRSFMLKKKEIKNSIGPVLYSMQLYDDSYFDNFHPDKVFEKWATVEVADFDNVPEHMESYLLSGGLYAVFLHKGLSTDNSAFQYIFTSWLPNADYILDNRPHFEILGQQFKNGDPDSEEEIWVPVKTKKINSDTHTTTKTSR